jgi:cytochrome P450/glutathione S-transferase
MRASTIYHPRMLSIPVSPYCELACWVLDRLGIPYEEECHAPVFNVIASYRYGGGSVVPLVDTGETVLQDARQVVNYYDARTPAGRRLWPEPSKARSEARELFDFFFETFGTAVRAWAYAYMLPQRRSTVRAWVARVPWWERVAVQILYPLLAAALRKNLALKPDTIIQQQQVIESGLAMVDLRLADGRRFLMGEMLTAPDLALAALAAPMLLPLEYSGPLPTMDEVPIPMRDAIIKWRARPAGRFILRIYHEERSKRTPDLVALGKHSSGRTLKDRLANLLVRPGMLRSIFTLLRRMAPILVIGKRVILTRHQDVKEVLTRDKDFTISEVNAAKINKIDGPFILGMDDSPQYAREKSVLYRVVRPEDLPEIGTLVARNAAELIDAARPQRRIDVVNGLARIAALRLVDSYFGMQGPNDATMMRWMRDVFHYIFANLTGAPTVLQDALNSGSELRQYMDLRIASAKSGPRQDMCVLGRLQALQGPEQPWLDDNAVRRNLGGLIVGAVDTTSKFVTLSVDELLRRPRFLAEARAAALRGDMEAVRGFAYEAVRFNPHHPIQVRYCANATRIAADTPRARDLPAGSLIYIASLSAMFDPAAFSHPKDFDAKRNIEYLHFGHGLHACFGRYINGVQIPELVAALLRLPNLRRTPGRLGHIVWDGPFPNRLILQFDN